MLPYGESPQPVLVTAFTCLIETIYIRSKTEPCTKFCGYFWC